LIKLAIIGSGGHTRSSTNLLLNYFDSNNIGIYDDSFVKDSKQEVINFIPLIGNIDDIKLNQGVFLSVGDNSLRKKYFLKFKEQIIKDTIFHSDSLQEKDIEFGISNQIFAHSYINSQVRIGDNNIINTGAIIEHEAVLGDHNHISVGVKICGRSTIGNMCLIGAGAVVIDDIFICDNTIIGAGSVVIQDIKEAGTYVGNPAKKIK
jgi:sugar O-acyltransferase (sialic acid O-acetyltransferase NeuD family)